MTGDSADQAAELTAQEERASQRAALRGERGDDSLGRFGRPLEDIETVIADEGADDASDDPWHGGGLHPAPLLSPEQSALHVIDSEGREWADQVIDASSADIDPFDRPGSELTPEDETLIGIDPYERPEAASDDEDWEDDRE